MMKLIIMFDCSPFFSIDAIRFCGLKSLGYCQLGSAKPSFLFGGLSHQPNLREFRHIIIQNGCRGTLFNDRSFDERFFKVE